MSNKIWCLLLVLAVVRASLATRCKKYVSRNRSVDRYFRFDDKNLRFMKKYPNGAIEMHISIQASTDGHIVLSPKPISRNPDVDCESVYAIVIGHDYDSKIELRRNQMPKPGNVMVTVDTPDILSATELRSFYIKISEDGVIEVGKEGSPPLIRYLDENPLDINYFGFSSWDDIKAIFLYDCPWPGSYSDHGSDHKHESVITTQPSKDKRPENEFQVNISGPDSIGTIHARLDIAVYGNKTGNLSQYRYLFGPMEQQNGTLNRPPYPYSGYFLNPNTATTSSNTETTRVINL